MKKIAIEKAELRLDAARKALDEIRNSSNFAQFLSAWGDFLTSLKGVHGILESSAHPKRDPSAAGWYGRKVGERRKDPLLKYVHAARNAHEYGVEPIAEKQHGQMSLSIGVDASGRVPDFHLEKMFFDENDQPVVQFAHLDHGPVKLDIKMPGARLVAVRDERFGDSFDVPEEHLGNKLPDQSPQTIAELALAYHEHLIEEARKYVL